MKKLVDFLGDVNRVIGTKYFAFKHDVCRDEDTLNLIVIRTTVFRVSDDKTWIETMLPIKGNVPTVNELDNAGALTQTILLDDIILSKKSRVRPRIGVPVAYTPFSDFKEDFTTKKL